MTNDIAFQLTKDYCRRLGHWINAHLRLWTEIGRHTLIFEKIMEFVRGPAPAMQEAWGRSVRELLQKMRGVFQVA